MPTLCAICQQLVVAKNQILCKGDLAVSALCRSRLRLKLPLGTSKAVGTGRIGGNVHWFYKEWWQYLLQPIAHYSTWFNSILCRIKGHPEGPIYYNIGGSEPNWHCKNCGDDIG